MKTIYKRYRKRPKKELTKKQLKHWFYKFFIALREDRVEFIYKETK
jgi:hypothetical protein